MVALVAAVVALALAGVSFAAATPNDHLPPSRRDAIAKLFDRQLRELGYRTTRASLVKHRIYGAPTDGPHLAIYVEPIDPAGVSPKASVDAILPLARIFLPRVFERWSDLASFDVCQEPASSADSSPSPAPLVQLALTRKWAKRVDWRRASLADLVGGAAQAGDPGALALGDTRKLYLFVDPTLADVGAYRKARSAVGLPATASSSTTDITG